jgi:hypothetical protein
MKQHSIHTEMIKQDELFLEALPVIFCRIRQARGGDQSSWRELKKLLNLAAVKKGYELRERKSFLYHRF